MGQKVNPTGFRLPVNRAWRSRWFAPKKNFAAFLVEDQNIREAVKKRLAEAGLSKILIERYANRVRVSLFSARPGVIIGRKGQDVDKVREALEKMTKKEVYLEIKEVRDADADAQLVAESIAQQLERRIALKRALKRAQKVAMDMGVDGIRAASTARRSRASSGAARARCRCTPFARTSITDSRRPTPRPARSASRFGSARRKISRRRAVRRDVAATAETVKEVSAMPLMPKRVKYRKQSKGNRGGYATSGTELAYGVFGLKALTRGYLTATQIEACRVAINREMKRKGKLWIRIFPDKPVTRKPIEVRMGGGKGNPEFWAAVILPGKVLFEIGGVSEEVARECLRLAATKIGIHTRFITRAGVKI